MKELMEQILVIELKNIVNGMVLVRKIWILDLKKRKIFY